MCGIAGLYIRDPNYIKSHAGLERFVNKMLLGIESRGKHATGFVAVDWAGNVVMDKADEEASKFIYSREPLPHDARMVLLHTRYATKGDPKEHVNNHPVISGGCFTTHNGHVDNDDELFKKYELPRIGEVDTEIIPALISKAEFKPENIQELFKDVDGKIAAATIDPKNHPDKVLLMRTKQSPLNLIETPHFMLWASTTETMREAWGSVLGTPPKHTRFKYVPEYRCLMVTPEGYTTFDLERPPVKVVQNRGGKPWSTQGRGRGYWQGGEWHSTEDKKDDEKDKGQLFCDVPTVDDPIAVTKHEVKEKVLEIRAKGAGVALTWEDAERKYGQRWVSCNTCDELVLDDKDNYVQTLQRGRMCIDCAHWYNKLWAQKAEEKADAGEEAEEGSEYDFDLSKYLSKHNIERFNRWAEDEGIAHGRALDSMAEYVGLTVEALDFLLFRLEITEETPKIIEELIQDLWVVYDDEYETEWTSMWPANRKMHKVFLNIPVKSDEETKELTKAMLAEGEPGKAGGPMLTNGNVPKREHSCLFCNKKPKHRIVAPNENWHSPGYCLKHFATCSTKGCSAKANHTRKDGIRVCHEHARGQKECHADSAIKKQGYQFAAVV